MQYLKDPSASSEIYYVLKPKISKTLSEYHTSLSYISTARYDRNLRNYHLSRTKVSYNKLDLSVAKRFTAVRKYLICIGMLSYRIERS